MVSDRADRVRVHRRRGVLAEGAGRDESAGRVVLRRSSDDQLRGSVGQSLAPPTAHHGNRRARFLLDQQLSQFNVL